MILNCSDDLLAYTYEALRLVSHYPFCVNKVEEQFTKLKNCGNDPSCVESIMCQEVRQQYCTAEWRVLELNESEGLIDCTNYGETAPLNCSNQFGLTNNGSICLPLCSEIYTTYYKPCNMYLCSYIEEYSSYTNYSHAMMWLYS